MSDDQETVNLTAQIKEILGECPGDVVFLKEATGDKVENIQEAILILIRQEEIEWYSPGQAFRLKGDPKILDNAKSDEPKEPIGDFGPKVRGLSAEGNRFIEELVNAHFDDPKITNKPKRPAVIPRPWSEFADAGMFWFVNRLLHVFGWAICREVEPDGTISGVYPARTRWRGFPEKDETEGFRKVTADIHAHIDDLVEDCKGRS